MYHEHEIVTGGVHIWFCHTSILYI